MSVVLEDQKAMSASADPLVSLHATRRRRAALGLHWREFALVLGVIDAFVVLIALLGTTAAFSEIPRFIPTPYFDLWLAATWAVWVLALRIGGAYEFTSGRPGRSDLGQLFRPASLVVLITLLAFFFAPLAFPRSISLVAPLAVLAALLLWRGVANTSLLNWSLLQRRILFLGIDETTSRLATALARNQRTVPYSALCFLTDEENVPPEIAGVVVIHDTGALWSYVRSLGIAEIAVGTRDGLSSACQRELVRCFYGGVPATDARKLYEELTGRVLISHIGADWYADFPTLPRRFYFGVKRAVDIIFSLIALVLLSPILFVLALLVLVDGGRPILYRQRRLGRHGEPFTIHKFRSMRADAETLGPMYATRDDPRSTRVGRLLRPTGLDELPQLWDVLRGRMSLIGPRPERPEFVEQLSTDLPLYRARLLVRPGISGWAEIHVPHAGSLREHLIRLEYDLYYIKHADLALDLQIALRTIGLVFSDARWRSPRPRPATDG
jgi:exopolysaccharide biosynthesis polyprenyl glycosylphosphotransferase